MDLHLRNNAVTHSLLLLGRIDAQEREKRKLSARMMALEKSVFAITEFLASLEQEGNFSKFAKQEEKQEGSNANGKPKLALSEIIRNLHQELARAKMTPEIKPREEVFPGPRVSLDPVVNPIDIPKMERVSNINRAPQVASSGSTETESKGSTSSGSLQTSSDSDDVQVEIQIHNPTPLPQDSSKSVESSTFDWDQKSKHIEQEEDESGASEPNPEDRNLTAETLAQMSEICASLSPKYIPEGTSNSRSRSRGSKRPRRASSFDVHSMRNSNSDMPSSDHSESSSGGAPKPPPRSTRTRRERTSTSIQTSSKSASRQGGGRRNAKLGIDQASFRAQTQQAARRVQQLMDEDGKLVSRKRKSRNRSLKQKFGVNAFEAPKKPKTAYNYYQIGVRESIYKELLRESGGSLGSKEIQSQKIARVIGERWKAMPGHERQIFNIMAAKDKERYKRDLDDYVRLNKQLEQSRKLTLGQQGKEEEADVLPGA
eukprot:CAMPEP_0197541538 /NCGR_PEP_ID=MMETSP1318-20131121/67210_1 /TAXON_ID=552666 /ORGANISM="Partenskyella glossopodia, Strain RCC365" /LENGTH=484 /DNA_ID=CAMNT_0043100725 /DNA_START=271 /DNA_END=1725 /DNA_ORIENTATION=+